MSSEVSIESTSVPTRGAATKLFVIALAVTFSTITTHPFAACAAGSSDVTSAATAAKTTTKAVTGKNGESCDALRMDDIQDVAFTLQRLRQQTLNVYVECTRKPVKHYELPGSTPTTIPAAPLEDKSAYLPLRKCWLVFFIGTMEPLVQMLNENLKRVNDRTEELGMPQQLRPEWQLIINDWTKGVHAFNKQLDVCATVVDDPASGNIEVAKAAIAMDSQLASLDTILHKASKFLQEKMPASSAANFQLTL